MNTIQRLLSNTLLAFISTALVKVSNSILFIMVGRTISLDEAGIFTLGITFYTIILSLSTWGLHELLVREVAPRRDQSGRYLLNYVVLRLSLSLLFYGLLLFLLRYLLPYSLDTQLVIRIMTLTIFAEAIFSLCQALFTAHERLAVPTLGSFINSFMTLAVGGWLLQNGQGVISVAWAIPLGMLAGLIVFPPALIKLFREVPQSRPARLDWRFSWQQLHYAPGFILIGIFSTLNFQADILIISLVMTKADLGYYGAAQTILMGFMLFPVAIRTALYPLMSRYKVQDPQKLAQLYRKSLQYLLLAALPMAMGITLLAEPIIRLVFGSTFDLATPALQWAIWAIVFLFLTVPPARMMLVHDKQQLAGWLRGLGMIVSVSMNIVLIQRFGLVGASVARVLASLVFFLLLFYYVQMNLQTVNLLAMSIRPLLATLIMAVAIWPLRNTFLLIPLFVGGVVYVAAIFLLGVVTAEDRYYLRQLVQTRVT